MNRRAVLRAFGVLTTAWASFAQAQSASRTYQIGYLGSGPANAPTDALSGALLDRLREFGYVEGQNLVVERRTTEGHNARYRALASELVNLGVDVVIAPGTAAALGAREATSSIPIVIVVAGDPVGSGLVASLAQPGGNVTGLSSSGGEVTTKQLELIKEIVPGLSRMMVLSIRTSALHATLLKELETAARNLRIRIDPVPVTTPQELEGAFTAIAKERPEALIPLDDPLTFQERRRIADFALRQRLPTASFQRYYTEAGTLVSYGPSFLDLFRRAAAYVDKILKGARPDQLPVEQPKQFELVINLKTAKALGLTIPRSLLLRADEVIE